MEQEVILRSQSLVEVDLSPAILEQERHKDLDLSLIGASDVPALLGLSPWAGPADVQRRILHGERDGASPAGFWGGELEASIIRAFAAGQGMTYTKPGSRSKPKGREWQRVSLDALSSDGGVILEAKCVSDWRWETEFSGGLSLPASIVAQVQTQLEAYDCDEAIVLVSRWDEPGRLWKEVVEPDPEQQAHILSVCEAFWQKHVIEKVPVEQADLPAPPKKPEIVVHDFTEEALLLEELSRKVSQIKRAGAEVELIKAKLREKLLVSEAARIKSNFGSVSRVKASVKEAVDWSAVAAAVRGRFTDAEWRMILQGATSRKETAGRIMVRTKGAPEGVE